MNPLKSFTTITFIIFSFGLFAQEYDVPKNYVLEKVEDFAEYESDVLKCIDWLLSTPINVQTSKRLEANAFVLKWISGSPNVTIDINPKIVNFIKPNGDLLMIFMCGWTKYSLESRVFNDKLVENKMGIEAVIAFYNKNKAFLKKDKKVEKYIKMKETGELDDYIKNNI